MNGNLLLWMNSSEFGELFCQGSGGSEQLQMAFSSYWSADHLELCNMAESGCSGCVHWRVGTFNINKCHALHTLPNRRIWFTHSLHVRVAWWTEQNMCKDQNTWLDAFTQFIHHCVTKVVWWWSCTWLRLWSSQHYYLICMIMFHESSILGSLGLSLSWLNYFRPKRG